MSQDWQTRLAASAAGAVAAEVVTLPTDVVKTRLQVQTKLGVNGMQYTGVINCFSKIIASEGVPALWKGFTPAVVRQVCYTGFAMVLYEPVRNLVTTQGETPTFGQRLLAGGASGAISISIFNPTEVIKTQLQSSQTKKSMVTMTKEIWRNDGIVGFWSGVKPNIARTFLVNAAELGTYDHAKSLIVPYTGDNIWGHLGASSVAGVTSAVVSTPADVVKTRLMNQAGKQHAYNGMFHATRTILKEEGGMAFYKGFVPIIVRKILWCASFFVTYENVRGYINTPVAPLMVPSNVAAKS